jgi:hypothetical protein
VIRIKEGYKAMKKAATAEKTSAQLAREVEAKQREQNIAKAREVAAAGAAKASRDVEAAKLDALDADLVEMRQKGKEEFDAASDRRRARGADLKKLEAGMPAPVRAWRRRNPY